VKAIILFLLLCGVISLLALGFTAFFPFSIYVRIEMQSGVTDIRVQNNIGPFLIVMALGGLGLCVLLYAMSKRNN